MEGWRYIALALDGLGAETMLAPDVPLDDVEFEPTLSGTPTFKASMPVEVPRFTDAGEAIFQPWSSVIAVEKDGAIRGCFIITDLQEQGPKLDITGVGFTGYLKGLPYEGEKQFVSVDALEVARDIWTNVQAQPRGNIGLRVDETDSGTYLGLVPPEQWKEVKEGSKQTALPTGTMFRYTFISKLATKAVTTKTTKIVNGRKTIVTVTTPAQPAVVETLYARATSTYAAPSGGTLCILRDKRTGIVTRDVTGSLGSGMEVIGSASKTAPKKSAEGDEMKAFELNWWTDMDLSASFDKVSEQGGFDYYEEHFWDEDDGNIAHMLRFDSPKAGRVRDDLRFAIGENVIEYPQIGIKGDDFASEVVVLGAGEGRAMVRGSWKLGTNTRARRPKVITDKTILTASAANLRAQREGLIANGAMSITSITVRDHPNAPIGSWGLGDTITVSGDGQGWGGSYAYRARVLSWTCRPEDDTAVLTIAQSERGMA